MDRVERRRDERRRARREFIREFMLEHMEFQRQQMQLRQRYAHCHDRHDLQRRQREYAERHRRFHQEFHHYHRRLKYIRPFIILLNLGIWYVLIRYLGIGTLGVIFAVLISLGGIYEILFLHRLEKRIFDPIDKLKQGVEEIAKGNYEVQVECDVMNDLTLLVASFNDMARRLAEGEKIKAAYEENRKDLLANISHDLKTPLTSIQGYIEAILDRKDLPRETTEKYLQIIYRNMEYMNKLIDDLFLFSKLDMAKLEFQFETIAARDFLNDLMEEFRLELEERGIGFSYRDQLGADEVWVRIDRKRIYQVIRNIISNAVKYGPGSGLRITIAAARQDGMMRMEIGDNGPGIEPDKLPFIFERFYRIDTERTKDVMSTGLGLAIARELVEAHGGSITAASVMGQGSCFGVMLPVAASREGEAT